MKVLVYAEVRDGKLKGTAKEILTAAYKLDANADVHAVLLGKGCKEFAPNLAKYGAKKVFAVEHELTDTYQGEPHVQALEQLQKQENYQAILGAASPTGRDFFPRLAMRLRSALITEVVDLSVKGGKVSGVRPIYAGKCLADVVSNTALTLVTIRPNVIPAVEKNGSGDVVSFAPSFDASKVKAKVKEVRKGKSEKPDLTEASVIISGGRALGNAENFKILHSCAEVIRATVGASRAAVDAGYASHEMQVGQTGKTVNPSLYIACGISGSIQHLAGMRTSKIIVAINTDPNAPIFQKADYGIVADLFQAVPVMEQEFKKLLGS